MEQRQQKGTDRRCGRSAVASEMVNSPTCGQAPTAGRPVTPGIRPCEDPDSKLTPILYVLAASHSGSTLLSMLLGAHPAVCTVGELKLTPAAMGDLRDYFCSCGDAVQQCEFWRSVTRELNRVGVSFDLRDADMDFRYGGGRYADRLNRMLVRGRAFECLRDAALAASPSWRKRCKLVQRRNTALAQAVLAASGKRIVVDSSKHAIRLKYLLRNDSLDVKVLRLIRDGRGVALTYVDPARFAAASDPGLQRRHEGTGMSLAAAARAWRLSNEEADRMASRLNPRRWVHVRYEELCDDPDSTLSRIFDFVGVDPKARISDFRAVEQHVIGNDMRLDPTGGVRLDDRWRKTLTPRDLRVFDDIAGCLNRKYGYD